MIVRATESDTQRLTELVNSAYRGDSSRKGWTTEADLIGGTRTDETVMSALLSQPDITILKYMEDNKIIGCVELKREGKLMYLGMLTVEPGLQGSGIGKKLMKAAEDEARKLSCTKIYMTVITVRKELIDWYIRHGFTDTGKRKAFEFPDVRWGVPNQQLEFMVLEKIL